MKNKAINSLLFDSYKYGGLSRSELSLLHVALINRAKSYYGYRIRYSICSCTDRHVSRYQYLKIKLRYRQYLENEKSKIIIDFHPYF